MRVSRPFLFTPLLTEECDLPRLDARAKHSMLGNTTAGFSYG